MPPAAVRRASTASLLVLVSLVAGATSCERRPPHPNIILLVVDTLRADRLGAYGNRRGLTPFLDELATKAVVFQNAFAPSSWTCPSVASLFTSRYPSQHHVASFDSIVPDEEVTLAERLRPAGYATGGLSANYRLLEPLGYAQGFQYWWAPSGAEKAPKLRADQLRSHVLEWLDDPGRGAQGGPTFLYLQFMEPHAPYQPPERYRLQFQRARGNVDPSTANGKLGRLSFNLGRLVTDELSREEIVFLESLYDGEIASLDAELRLLFAELERRGVLEHAIVVVTADHGEEFHEHGGMLHGRTLYGEVIRVPLLLLAPRVAGGRVVTENVSLVDVAPTILELAREAPEPHFEGRSLVPLLEGDAARPADVLAELEHNEALFDFRRHAQALIRGATKLLVSPEGEREAYDLADDPREFRPNPPALSEQTAALAQVLQRSSATLAQRASVARKGPTLDEATKERLRALGYVL